MRADVRTRQTGCSQLVERVGQRQEQQPGLTSGKRASTSKQVEEHRTIDPFKDQKRAVAGRFQEKNSLEYWALQALQVVHFLLEA